jgi:cytidylate kinase
MYAPQRSVAAEILESLQGRSPGSGTASPPAFAPLGGLLAPMVPPASIGLDEAVRTLGLIIKDLASQGNMLILGQAGQMLLQDYQGACHVQLVAPFALRVSRIAERDRLSQVEARRRVRNSDRDRGGYLARYFGVDWQDPFLYHLVVNTGRTPSDIAVALIVSACQALART